QARTKVIILGYEVGNRLIRKDDLTGGLRSASIQNSHPTTTGNYAIRQAKFVEGRRDRNARRYNRLARSRARSSSRDRIFQTRSKGSSPPCSSSGRRGPDRR